MSHQKNFERGQAVLLLMLAMVGLLGFTALAIDGGMVYAERRAAQNAADAAALAGALAKVSAARDVDVDALQRAAENGYVTNGDNTVEVNNPPVRGPYTGDDEYVQVIITSSVQTSLIHFVYNGPVVNSVEAVARAQSTTYEPLYFGNALVGLAPHGEGVVKSGGNANTFLYNAGIWVNSDKVTGEGGNGDAFEINGTGYISITNGTVSVVGGADISGGGLQPSGIVSTNSPQMPYPPLPEMEPPKPGPSECDYTVAALSMDADGVGGPGDKNLNLGEDNIWCVTGSGKSTWGSTDIITGTNVLIYIQNPEHDLEINGGATVQLDAMDSGDYPGMLFYFDPGSYNFFSATNPVPVCTVILNGNGYSNIIGTVYAPACDIKLNGTGGADGFDSQLIGYTVDLNGTADLTLDFHANKNHKQSIPASIDLSQ